MRIIQLIDSLEAGGAERMAVHYANGLAARVAFSGLVCTRKEGLLRKQLHAQVDYLFLNKKSAIDLQALFRLRRYCKQHQISHVQAHATSFFTAFLLQLILPKLKVIWHDHYGLSEFLPQRRPQLLWLCSHFFSGIISVNEVLKKWSQDKLACSKVMYLPNFVTTDTQSELISPLAGTAAKRILCLANLRPQKNHALLLKVASMLKDSHPDWTFHLVGQDFNDVYAAQIKQTILDNALEQHVFVYGSRADTAAILDQATIGVLTSNSEGLPLAVLEYGLHALPVLVTRVGDIPSVIYNQVDGVIAEVDDAMAFYKSLVELIENPNLRLKFGRALQAKINQFYTEEGVMNHFLHWTQSI
ncbi:MAG: glycosyltransferase [Flavobacterium sp.]|nr:glycosyltransferase [Flavobacterium sp.]